MSEPTETQIMHHAEQVEACRAHFQCVWILELLPRIHGLETEVTTNQLALLKDIAWQSFRKGKGL